MKKTKKQGKLENKAQKIVKMKLLDYCIIRTCFIYPKKFELSYLVGTKTIH